MSIIFKGSAGVRAGWRFGAYIVLLVGLYFVLGGGIDDLVSWINPPQQWRMQLGPGQMAINEIELAAGIVAASGIMALLERRSILSYGFMPTAEARPRFLEGVAMGVIAPLIVMLLMLAFGGMQIHGAGLSGIEWLIYPFAWLAVMAMVGFFEEAAFRGYPLFALARGIGFWPAAVATTALFVLAHAGKQGENWIDLSSVGFIGLFACFTLWKTGSLWLAAGFHFAFDYMQFFVIGTPNGSAHPVGTLLNATFAGPAWVNGGPLGTEASCFAFPVTVLMFLYIMARYPRAAFAANPSPTAD